MMTKHIRIWKWKWKLLCCAQLFATPWTDSPGQNIRVGSLSLLQGIFPTQGANSGLPHCRQFFTSGKPKNTGLSSLSLLQRMFLTQEWNLGLLHCRLILYQLSYQGSPIRIWDIPIQCPNPWGSASSSLWLLFSLSGVWYLVNTHGCKQGISCSSDSLEHSTHNKATEEYLNF